MLSEEELNEAIANYTPQVPEKNELGGDYYFKCGWAICNADIKKWWNYCPMCGGRINWEER